VIYNMNHGSSVQRSGLGDNMIVESGEDLFLLLLLFIFLLLKESSSEERLTQSFFSNLKYVLNVQIKKQF